MFASNRCLCSKSWAHSLIGRDLSKSSISSISSYTSKGAHFLLGQGKATWSEFYTANTLIGDENARSKGHVCNFEVAGEGHSMQFVFPMFEANVTSEFGDLKFKADYVYVTQVALLTIVLLQVALLTIVLLQVATSITTAMI